MLSSKIATNGLIKSFRQALPLSLISSRSFTQNHSLLQDRPKKPFKNALNKDRQGSNFNNKGFNNRRYNNDRNANDRYPQQDRTSIYTDRLTDHKGRTRFVKFTFETASDQGKLAIKDLIKEVQKVNPTYEVQFRDDVTKESFRSNLSEIVNQLDFAEDGLTVSFPRQESGKVSLPIIKKVSIKDMLKKYSDKLAAQKEKELLESGSTAARKAAQHKLQVERKKSAIKVVPISWSISDSDLRNQKFLNIQKRVEKQDKFFVYIGDKSSLSASRKLNEKEQLLGSLTNGDTLRRTAEDSLEIELLKREKLVDKVRQLLVELGCPFEETGSVDARAAFDCTPRKTAEPKGAKTAVDSSGELSEKELKKQRRLEKAKAKEEEKAKASVPKDDLDSLYSFKLDD
ncbi:hypothetical protein FT663_01594 [Candidozyma haemuli var. vulneris]|uniref:Altered inheritance of mitochondria protein 23, mitochondrial n=1 Tax=Candidozyma haemuli TaxID=45357 RepID=A0A2V1AXE7_9ASCO|nr:hypothetical protein CXQ85_005061 [[Candida] haemuloni]KAF3986501.1 hypothetical protein FT662_04534 [[Candida] haemuloni var. vulneris]KAF3994094.1 hypothetical protein FT663_01594 [[Candida] haemuloni var. vulneris]PVH22492.1 hypothetical protein CXQ85_005061 [[Candida] haemuloni]